MLRIFFILDKWYFINNDKRTLGIILKIGINKKELDPNRDLPVEPKLSKEHDPNRDLPVEPTLSVLNPRTKEKFSQ